MIKRRNTSQRRGLILQELESKKEVSVYDLSKKHKVSAVTIRHDLNKLALQGLLTRTSGGALFVKSANSQKGTNRSKYADHASRLVKNGETILLPHGKYATAMIERLTEWNKGLTIITNSIEIATRCRGYFECNLLGGKVLDDGGILIDEEFLSNYYCDKLFLEVDGISLKSGLFSQNLELSKIYRAMIKASESVYVIASPDIFTKKGAQRISDIDQVDVLITDYSTSPKDKAILSQSGTKIERVT